MKALVSPSPLLRASRLLVAAGLAWSVLAGLAAGDLAARRTAPLAGEQWLLLASNRDGAFRGYSMLTEGARLTSLIGARSRLVPIEVSQNGATVAYLPSYRGREPVEGPLTVSAASGRGLRRVAKEAMWATLSRDGRWIAYSNDVETVMVVRSDGRGRRRVLRGCSCFVADWSPDRRSLLVEVGVETSGGAKGRVVVVPLRGKRRVVARTGEDTGQHADYEGATWSPDGRWIAYLDIEDNGAKLGLYLVRPNGTRLHRIVRGAVLAMAWSPDGKKLAFISEKGRVAVVGADGRGLRRLPLALTAKTVAWSPDGQRLAVAATAGEDRSQIFVVGEDGRDARRVTARVRTPSSAGRGAPRLCPRRRRSHQASESSTRAQSRPRRRSLLSRPTERESPSSRTRGQPTARTRRSGRRERPRSRASSCPRLVGPRCCLCGR